MQVAKADTLRTFAERAVAFAARLSEERVRLCRECQDALDRGDVEAARKAVKRLSQIAA